MTITNKIRAALESHLIGMTNIPKVVPSNTKYDPQIDTPFMRCKVVPIDRRPDVRGLNPQQRYDGFFRILICMPSHSGEGDSLTLADRLLARFEATTDIAYEDIFVRIDYAEIATGYPDSALPFYCTPVTVRWYTYK